MTVCFYFFAPMFTAASSVIITLLQSISFIYLVQAILRIESSAVMNSFDRAMHDG